MRPHACSQGMCNQKRAYRDVELSHIHSSEGILLVGNLTPRQRSFDTQRSVHLDHRHEINSGGVTDAEGTLKYLGSSETVPKLW